MQASFGDSFWGPNDIGFSVLMERMADARITNEEIRAFFRERAAIEEEYAKKLSRLAREPLGSTEIGSLKESLETLRLETGNTADSHTAIASQLRTDLEAPHITFSDASREKRKAIQNGVEKTFKLKIQQQQEVKKAKDRCDSEFLKANGFMAQQNLLLGKELEKNNSRLEKAHGALQIYRPEYETAVAQLGNVAERWQREWRQACDRFQGLEEERIETTKTELWTYANVMSQVCVTDDESCEKVRLSLEKCNINEDIQLLIKQRGTGNETPLETTFLSSHKDNNNERMLLETHRLDRGGQAGTTGRHEARSPMRDADTASRAGHAFVHGSKSTPHLNSKVINEYPLDGITQLCRSDSSATFASASTGLIPHTTSSSVYSVVPARSATVQGFASHEPNSSLAQPELRRKKSMLERAELWTRRSPSPSKQLDSIQPLKAQKTGSSIFDALRPARSRSRAGSRAENPKVVNPVQVRNDPRVADVLNIGKNMLPVSGKDKNTTQRTTVASDPIAAALQRLSVNVDQHLVSQEPQSLYGISDGSEQAQPRGRGLRRRVSSRSVPSSPVCSQEFDFINRPHPNTYVSCNNAFHGLDAPPAAHSAAEMRQTAQHAKRSSSAFFGPELGTPALITGNTRSTEAHAQSRPSSRSMSAHPPHMHQAPGNLRRSPSPIPLSQTINMGNSADSHSRPGKNNQRQNRARSPESVNQQKLQTQRENSYSGAKASQQMRYPYSKGPGIAGNDQALGTSSSYMNEHSRNSWQHETEDTRPQRSKSYDVATLASSRPRSKSIAEAKTQKHYTKDGREILAIVTALYDYEATIQEEIDFRQGDTLAIIEMREDGWWLGEAVGAQRICRGLVPSNFFRRAL